MTSPSLFSFLLSWVGVASLLLGTSPNVCSAAFDQTKIVVARSSSSLSRSVPFTTTRGSFVSSTQQRRTGSDSISNKPFGTGHAVLDTRLFVDNPRQEDRFQLKQAGTTLSFRDEFEDSSSSSTPVEKKNKKDEMSTKAATTTTTPKIDTSLANPTFAFLMLAMLMMGSMAVSSSSFDVSSIQTALSGSGINMEGVASSFASTVAAGASSANVQFNLDLPQGLPSMPAMQGDWMGSSSPLFSGYASEWQQASIRFTEAFSQSVNDMQTMSFPPVQIDIPRTMPSLSAIQGEWTNVDLSSSSSSISSGYGSEWAQASTRFTEAATQGVINLKTTTLPQMVTSTQTAIGETQDNLARTITEVQAFSTQASNDIAASVTELQQVTIPATMQQASDTLAAVQEGGAEAVKGAQASLATIPDMVTNLVAATIANVKASALEIGKEATAVAAQLQASAQQTAQKVELAVTDIQTSLPRTMEQMTLNLKAAVPQTMSTVQDGFAASMSKTEVAVSNAVHDLQGSVTASMDSVTDVAHNMGERVASVPTTVTTHVQQTVVDLKSSPQVGTIQQLVRNTFPPMSEVKQAVIAILQQLSLKVAAVREALAGVWVKQVAQVQGTPEGLQDLASKYVNDLQGSLVQTQSILEESKKDLGETVSNMQPLMNQVQDKIAETTSTTTSIVQDITASTTTSSASQVVTEAPIQDVVTVTTATPPPVEVIPTPVEVPTTLIQQAAPKVVSSPPPPAQVVDTSSAAMDRLEKLLLDN